MGSPWTPEENQILKDKFSVMSDSDIQALIPSHTIYSIQKQARKFNLTKTKEYRIAYLKVNRINSIETLKGSTPWNKQEPIHKICETCGKDFEITKGRQDRARFCSRICVNQWLATTNGETHWHYRKVNRTCEWCGKSFTCIPAKVAHGEGLYCSRNCLGSAKTMLQNGRRSSLELAIEKVLIALDEPFEAQKQIGPWLVDFYLPERNLIIECDGKYWHGLPEVVKRDRQKNYWIYKNGYKLLRLGEDDINVNAMEAVQQGLKHLPPP